MFPGVYGAGVTSKTLNTHGSHCANRVQPGGWLSLGWGSQCRAEPPSTTKHCPVMKSLS